MSRNLTLDEFINVLGSDAPAPGGGGASALVGATGTALGIMVGSLTVGKKKYADVEGDIKALMAEAEELKTGLLEDIDNDAKCFEPLAKAYGLPANTEEEKAEKERIMEDALKTACTAPVAIMEKACRAIELLAEFAEKGSRLAVSDAACGAVMMRSALEGASLNVYINAKSMKDRPYAEELISKVDGMLNKYAEIADNIFAEVVDELR